MGNRQVFSVALTPSAFEDALLKRAKRQDIKITKCEGGKLIIDKPSGVAGALVKMTRTAFVGWYHDEDGKTVVSGKFNAHPAYFRFLMISYAVIYVFILIMAWTMVARNVVLPLAVILAMFLFGVFKLNTFNNINTHPEENVKILELLTSIEAEHPAEKGA